MLFFSCFFSFNRLTVSLDCDGAKGHGVHGKPQNTRETMKCVSEWGPQKCYWVNAFHDSKKKLMFCPTVTSDSEHACNSIWARIHVCVTYGFLLIFWFQILFSRLWLDFLSMTTAMGVCFYGTWPTKFRDWQPSTSKLTQSKLVSHRIQKHPCIFIKRNRSWTSQYI